ncbi:MAG: CapA family protein [Patescibacteria group bacterium]|nr:CapA family protein [Patescibacteria group bacterium]
MNIFNALVYNPQNFRSDPLKTAPSSTNPNYLLPNEAPNLTLGSIFENATASSTLDLAKFDPKKLTTIIVTGDIIPARSVNYKMTTYNNFRYPFEKTVDFLKSGDLTFSNLESPLTNDCQDTTEGMTFCGNQRFIEGLTYAGIDIVSLANNHSGNYGSEGIKQTEDLLSENKIDYVGAGNTIIKEIHGVKFAFLAFNGVGNYFDQEEIKGKIHAARKASDVVIVAPHWGKEYVSIPESSPGVAPDDPKEIAHLIVDAGADLVIGNHPHWAQGVEIYKDKFIAYAHGNFIFDQMWSQETREGVVGKYTFYDKKLINVKFYPVLIEDYSQPHFLSDQEGDLILERMRQASEKIQVQTIKLPKG